MTAERWRERIRKAWHLVTTESGERLHVRMDAEQAVAQYGQYGPVRAIPVEVDPDGTQHIHGARAGADIRKRPDLADLRRGRWYDEKPITTTTGSAGGAVSSIEEVRAGIMAANEHANEGLGAVQQAHASLETAQATLMHATEGSGQADVSEANGLLAQAVNSLDEVRQQVAAAISAAESVGNRL